jgi:hypothetical protein
MSASGKLIESELLSFEVDLMAYFHKYHHRIN